MRGLAIMVIGTIALGWLASLWLAYLRCGRLEHGVVHVQRERCQEEMVVAFSCKGRGFCGYLTFVTGWSRWAGLGTRR